MFFSLALQAVKLAQHGIADFLIGKSSIFGFFRGGEGGFEKLLDMAFKSYRVPHARSLTTPTLRTKQK